jgi:hypothetical protein
MPRPDYREALADSGVLDALAAFDPHVAGTPPLGLDLPGSDIDVLCHAPDADAFCRSAWSGFAGYEDFAMHQWRSGGRPVIVRFLARGWAFELFASAEPVFEQPGWRHFMVERRLLALGGDRLRNAVMAARRGGLKTEPAFAKILGLSGDPYSAMLAIEVQSDSALAELLRMKGY